ncbi:hypothetical protein ACOMHN_059998 [Nucella lapillus]
MIRYLPALWLLVTLVYMMSLPTSGQLEAEDLNCYLCERRCGLEDCYCKNKCIGGIGNDCKRIDRSKVSYIDGECLKSCGSGLRRCLDEDCASYCPRPVAR